MFKILAGFSVSLLLLVGSGCSGEEAQEASPIVRTASERVATEVKKTLDDINLRAENDHLRFQLVEAKDKYRQLQVEYDAIVSELDERKMLIERVLEESPAASLEIVDKAISDMWAGTKGVDKLPKLVQMMMIAKRAGAEKVQLDKRYDALLELIDSYDANEVDLSWLVSEINLNRTLYTYGEKVNANKF